jgi:hypothetical protein
MALVEIQCCKVIDATSTPNGFAAACLGLSTRFFLLMMDRTNTMELSCIPASFYRRVHISAIGRVTIQRHDKVIFGGKRC